METKLTLLLKKLNSLPFKEAILEKHGAIYAVGGVLRDAFLDKESKDFDIMITRVDNDILINLLKEFGRVDLVGESFGIIKFKAFNSTEDIDISIPRKEISTGDRGHKSFSVTTNPFLPIEEDMRRRDITINSMALDTDGNIIDPFDGLEDLRDRKIRATDESTFYEDPLRMLRCVQFASRFDFDIESKTLESIKTNAHRISEISKERIIDEFNKIVTKGNKFIAAMVLIDTELYEHIFKSKFSGNFNDLFYVKTLAEFIFILNNKHFNTSDFYKIILKGDDKTYKELKALEKINSIFYESVHTVYSMKYYCYQALNIFTDVIKTKIFLDKKYIIGMEGFINGKYPKSLKELQINGNELMTLGLVGPEIGLIQKKLVALILDDILLNDKQEILNYLA